MCCHKCGRKTDEGSSFCPFCGAKLEMGQDRRQRPPETEVQSGTPKTPAGNPPEAAPQNGPKPNETPSKFTLWWAHAQMIEKVFFILGVGVIAIVAIALLVNFWEILVGILVIAGVVTAFVTGSKEEKSEIRRFILKGAASLLLIAALVFVVMTNQDFFENLIQPGMGVRNAYLTQYSEDVTVEEAFQNFFENPQWSTYQESGYTYVVFTGNCEYMDERVDVSITFQITGEQFRADHLDINGVEQNDLILYGLFTKIYEGY